MASTITAAATPLLHAEIELKTKSLAPRHAELCMGMLLFQRYVSQAEFDFSKAFADRQNAILNEKLRAKMPQISLTEDAHKYLHGKICELLKKIRSATAPVEKHAANGKTNGILKDEIDRKSSSISLKETNHVVDNVHELLKTMEYYEQAVHHIPFYTLIQQIEKWNRKTGQNALDAGMEAIRHSERHKVSNKTQWYSDYCIAVLKMGCNAMERQAKSAPKGTHCFYESVIKYSYAGGQLDTMCKALATAHGKAKFYKYCLAETERSLGCQRSDLNQLQQLFVKACDNLKTYLSQRKELDSAASDLLVKLQAKRDALPNFCQSYHELYDKLKLKSKKIHDLRLKQAHDRVIKSWHFASRKPVKDSHQINFLQDAIKAMKAGISFFQRK